MLVLYYVNSNMKAGLGQKVHADSPQEAAEKSGLKGPLIVRWGVKFGEPGKTTEKESDTWWFANTKNVMISAPKAAPKKQEEAKAPKEGEKGGS